MIFRFLFKKFIFWKKFFYLKLKILYIKKISFHSKSYPSSKHKEDPKAKIEMKSQLKYNLEDKMSGGKIEKRFNEK